MAEDYRRYIDELTEEINRQLAQLVPHKEPADLYEPARYVLEAPGKRLRPLLLLLSAGIFDVPEEDAMPAALALEVFHTFTLVHDDIMDRADARRGKPTVHMRWDEGTAILCGDWLMGLSYQLLSRVPRGDLRAILNRYHNMVTRLCEGQALDKAFETRQDVTLEAYMQMIEGKTGALIQTALVTGGLLSEAPEEVIEKLEAMGWHLGRAFQIQDDLLDVVAEDKAWGKPVGGDLVEGKKTFLLLRALEKAEGEDARFFNELVARGGLEPSRIPEARERMRTLGVLDDAREEVQRHYEEAQSFLAYLPSNRAAHTLQWLLETMSNRVR